MSEKIVLIITSQLEGTVSFREREKYVSDFCESVQDSIKSNSRVLYTTFSDLEYTVVDGVTKIFDTRRKLGLDCVSFVHFKNWTGNYALAKVLAQYLIKNNIKFNNSEVGEAFIVGKIAQMFLFADHKLPVPDTFFCFADRMKDLFKNDKLPDFLSYPIIMKADSASRGHDNYLINDSKSGYDIIGKNDNKKNYVLQQFIRNEGDYRILFIGLNNQPLIFHRQALDGSHLNNTSRGGSGTLVDAASVPTETIDDARLAAQVVGREIGGVDIMVDAVTGRQYILEVNSTPALATGYESGLKVEQFAKYIDSLMSQIE